MRESRERERRLPLTSEYSSTPVWQERISRVHVYAHNTLLAEAVAVNRADGDDDDDGGVAWTRRSHALHNRNKPETHAL